MTITELCDYYKGLLAWEYKGLPKASAQMFIYTQALLGDLLAQQLQTAFVVDTAIGAQLDIIGKYVGLPRNIGDPAPVPYFGYVSYIGGDPQNTNGFTAYDNTLNQGTYFYDYVFNNAENTALTDEQYRFMLKLRIFLNSSDASLYDIQLKLQQFFMGYITVTDNANMTLTYHISDNTPVSSSVLIPYLPKPLGVRIITDLLLNRVLMDGTTERVTQTGDTRVINA